MKRFILIAICFFTANFGLAQDNYRVERIIQGGAKNISESNLVIFNVFSESDNKLYSVTKTVDYDIPFPSANVFSDGSLSIVNSFDASVEYYNNKGESGEHLLLLGEKNVEYERAVYTSLDINQLFLAVMDGNESGSEVFVTTHDGIIKNQWKVESDNISGVALDSKRELVFVSGYRYDKDEIVKRTTCYKSDGAFIKSSEILFDKHKLENNSVLIGFTNKNAFSFDLDELEFQNEFTLETSELILDAAVTSDGIEIIVANQPQLVKGNWFYNDASLLRIKNSTVSSRVKLDIPYDFNQIKLFKESDKTKIIVNDEIIEIN